MKTCDRCGPTHRRNLYKHESGKMLCLPCLRDVALNGRKDFREEEKPAPVRTPAEKGDK